MYIYKKNGGKTMLANTTMYQLNYRTGLPESCIYIPTSSAASNPHSTVLAHRKNNTICSTDCGIVSSANSLILRNASYCTIKMTSRSGK